MTLISESPTHFEPEVITPAADRFRLKDMSREYSKPLRILLHMFQRLGGLPQLPPEAPPIYSQIDHSSVYGTLVFLLDYALHTPPNILDLWIESPDVPTMQDIYPPLRFLMLALLLASEIRTNRFGCRDVLLDQNKLYSDASDALAAPINMYRNKTRTEILGQRHPKNTFFPFRNVTKMWMSEFEKMPFLPLSPKLYMMHVQALKTRDTDPDLWLRLDPDAFCQRIAPPRIVMTRRGVVHMSYAITTLEKGVDNPVGNTEYADAFGFIDELTVHEMCKRFGQAVFQDGDMRCPVTELPGDFVRCEKRTHACESICDIKTLPKEGCPLRRVIEKVVGDVEQFQRNSRSKP